MRLIPTSDRATRWASANVGPNRTRRDVVRGLGLGASLAAIAVWSTGREGAARPAMSHEEDGLRGVELLRAWAAGDLPRQLVPAGWAVAAPPLGAGFFYPPRWEVTVIVDPNRADLSDGDPFGAWVVAPDESATVLMLNIVANGPVSARDAAWAQVREAIGEAEQETLAEDRYDRGAVVPHALVAVRSGTTIVAAHVAAMPETEFGRTYLYVLLVAAAAADFDETTERVFLPLLQNLVTGGPGDCDRDPDDDDDSSDDCWEPDA